MSKNIFKKKPKYTYEVGGGVFKLEFYIDEKNPKGNYLHITTLSGVFEQKVCNYPFGYLLAASQQGKTSELEAYCVLLYRVSEEIYQDLGFCNDIIKAIQKRDKRLMKQGESNAKATSESQNEADTAFMQSVVEFAEADPKRRKEIQAEDKQILKDVLSEKGEGE